jgi:phage-related tail fiber protein
VDRQQQQADSSKLETAITFGATVLGALLGRKKLTTTSLGRATTTARGYGKMTRQSEEVRRAQDTLEAHRQQLEELETQLAEETQAISDQLEPMTLPVESIELAPRKTDVDVRWVAVAWVPTAG